MDKGKAQSLLPIPNNDAYRFYSIFQWSNRKNPEALFKAYFNEFGDENVQLVVKTYGPSPFADRRIIKEAIQDMKADSKSSAQVYLFGELMTPEQIDAIHAQGDCYVTTTRGEGLNIPLLTAMAYKQQVITPNTGGIADWLGEDTAYIIPHKQVEIDASTQAWGGFYKSDPPQKWGDVEINDVRKAMRAAFNERNDFSWRIKGYDAILKYSSMENVSGLIKERLLKI